MSDKRKHRGPHPHDERLFDEANRVGLRRATFELAWLRARGYADAAALKLVGDRYGLRGRQRDAIRRSASTDAERERRAQKRVDVDDLHGRHVALDGFNCVIALEAALSGAPLLLGRDRVLRDLSSVHGSYRKVEETARAVELIIGALCGARVAAAHWYLDRPVSNSGRLKHVIGETAAAAGLACEVDLVNNPDAELVRLETAVVASGDAVVLDGCRQWIDLPAAVLRNHDGVWLVDLSGDGADPDPE